MTRRKTALSSLLLVALLGACSSTTRYALLGTRTYATTEGEARIEPHDGGGYDLEVSIDRLPTYEHLGPDVRAFVVWVKPEGHEAPERVAVLDVDAISRVGTAHALVSTERFEVRITAEASAEPEAPSEIVLVHALLQPPD